MRKLVAWVFMYSLDSLLAAEGTEYWQFGFGLAADRAELNAARKVVVSRTPQTAEWPNTTIAVWVASACGGPSSSTAFTNGIVGLPYRRHRSSPSQRHASQIAGSARVGRGR